jgi:hypothetical protein
LEPDSSSGEHDDDEDEDDDDDEDEDDESEDEEEQRYGDVVTAGPLAASCFLLHFTGASSYSLIVCGTFVALKVGFSFGLCKCLLGV